MITYLHYAQGTTIIHEDGEYGGYDSSRHDELINAEIIHPDGINNVRIYMDKYNVVIRYKYLSYNPITGNIMANDKIIHSLDRYKSECNHIKYMIDIANELLNEQSIGGDDVCYRIAMLIKLYGE